MEVCVSRGPMTDAITIQRVFELRQKMAAFTDRDVQTVAIYFKWGLSLGYTVRDLLQYADVNVYLTELNAVGYFSAVTAGKEHQKRIKEIEHKLPKELRKELRTARLANSFYGVVTPGRR